MLILWLATFLLAALVLLLFIFRKRFLECTVAKTVTVYGDITSVFDYLADFSNAEEWDPNVKDARWVTQPHPKPTVGDTFELTTLFHDRASVTRYVLTSVDPTAGVLTLQGESDAATMNDTITLTESFVLDAVGRTRIDYRLDVRLKGKLALGTFLVRPALEALATESIGGLVTACAKKFGSAVRFLEVPDDGSGLPLGGRDMRSRKPPPAYAPSALHFGTASSSKQRSD